MKYVISLHGCDDSTYMIVKLTEEEAKVIELISDLSYDTSTYTCMPTLDIELYNEEQHSYQLERFEESLKENGKKLKSKKYIF